MKKSILLLITISLFISVIGAENTWAMKDCLTDNYGYTWSLKVTSTGSGNYSVSGKVNVGAPSKWTVSGSISGNMILLTATNPDADGCVSGYSDYFNYKGTLAGSNVSGSWYDYCSGSLIDSGLWTGVFTKGNCQTLSNASFIGSTVSKKYPAVILANEKTPERQSFDHALSLQLFPNPASNAVTISYNGPDNGTIKISICNILGSPVKVLTDQGQSLGNHSLEWNLTDMNGARVPGGTYFVKAELNGAVQSALLIILK